MAASQHIEALRKLEEQRKHIPFLDERILSLEKSGGSDAAKLDKLKKLRQLLQSDNKYVPYLKLTQVPVNLTQSFVPLNALGSCPFRWSHTSKIL